MGQEYRTVRIDEALTIATAVADSGVINLRDSVLLSVAVPTGSSLTTITWYGCQTEGGTYLPLEYPPGTALASSAISAPVMFQVADGMCAHPYVKGVGNVAETVSITTKS
jgi:hypothetical protein